MKRIETTCTVPLETSEFSTFEKIPDGLLYADEFGDDELDTFACRYLITADGTVRREYRGKMKNGLIEAVRDRLSELDASNGLTDELAARRDRIVGYELADNDLDMSLTVGMETEFSGSEDLAAAGYEMSKRDLVLRLGGEFSISKLFTFTDEKLKLRSTLTLLPQYQGQSTASGFGDMRADGSAVYSNLKVDADYFSRDDSWAVSVGGYHKHLLGDVAPDQMMHSSHIEAGGEYRNAFDLPLFGNLSFKWDDSQSQQPSNQEHFRLRSGGGEGEFKLSYYIDDIDAGLIWKSTGGKNDVTKHSRKSDTGHFDSSALIQLRLTPGHVLRVGAGGGYSTESFERADTDENGNSEGGTFHGLVEYDLNVDSWLEVSAKASVTGNVSEGTFDGIYPSWTASTHAAVSLLDGNALRMGLDLTHEGRAVALNVDQERLSWSASPFVAFRPLKGLELTAKGTFTFESVTGYESHESFNINPQLSASYYLGDDSGCSVFGYGYYFNGRWENSDVSRWSGFGGGAGLQCPLSLTGK